MTGYLKRGLKIAFSFTKEPFDYIANTIGVLAGIAFLFDKYQHAKIEIQSLIIILSLSFLIFIIKNIKAIFDHLVYSFDLKNIEINTSKKLIASINDFPIDYDKIIPKTRILFFLLTKAKKLVFMKWAKDSVLTRCYLIIANKYRNHIEIDIQFTFYSPKKRMEVSFEFSNLKLSSKNLPNNWKLSYCENGFEEKVFFTDPLWRQAVISSFEYTESELVDKTFFALISGNYPYGMRIGIMPDGSIFRNFTYHYHFKDKKLFDNDFPSEKSKVIADFNEVKLTSGK